MEGWEGVSVVCHSCVTTSNCKSKKVEVPSEYINIFETGCSQQALVSLGTLSNPDDDGGENVSKK